jgi:arsenate reductase (thioredoxin)
MSDRVYRVLFLCTGNSARSVMAEALLNYWGKGRFRAYSAGSHPAGRVHPLTLETLRRAGLPAEGLRSKSWDEFALPGAAPMDFVFTVCDNAAGEVCPVWPGRPITAHWGFQDPAASVGDPDARLAVFKRIFGEIQARVQLFASLRVDALDRLALQRKVDEIGRTTPAGPRDSPSIQRASPQEPSP